jgi:hypothetical protein
LPGFDSPEDAMAKLEAGEDGTIICKNQAMQCIYPIQDAPLDQGHMIELNYIRQDFMDLAVGPNQRGATAGVDSATEAGILESRARIREGDKQGMVIDFDVKLATKLDQLIQANITQDQAIKVTGAAGESWQQVRTTDYDNIAGEYEYQVDVGSVKPKIPEIERAQLMQFLTLFSNPMAVQILGTNKPLMKKVGEIFEMDQSVMDELGNIANTVAQGQMPGLQQGGQQGSMPGIPESNPVAMLGGKATGMANFRGGQ